MNEAATLEVSVRDEAGQRTLFAVGEINLNSAPDFQTQLKQAVVGVSVLKVHLGGVTFIDSSGIAVLVRALKQAQEVGTEMVLVALSKEVKSVLDLTNVSSLFRIETSDGT